jgi:hypothetical protein
VISIRSRHSRRAWRPHRRLDDPHADGGEYRVEGRGELGVPVTDQELQTVRLTFHVHQQVTGLLDHPVACGVGGDAGQVHAAGAVLDEELIRTGAAYALVGMFNRTLEAQAVVRDD